MLYMLAVNDSELVIRISFTSAMHKVRFVWASFFLSDRRVIMRPSRIGGRVMNYTCLSVCLSVRAHR